MATSPDTLRARLEDRADLLEAARLRYRALRLMLRGFFWRDTLRSNLELLREVVRDQSEVDMTLASVCRRAAAEAWPKDSASMLLLAEVSQLHEALARLVARRLRTPTKPPVLADALLLLEEELLAEGPLLGRRSWAQAVELLPRNLPELRAACAAAEIFERIFKRPVIEGALPFNAAEADEIRRALPLADTAKAALWSRVHRFDPSGRLTDFLEKRARRVPVRTPRSGPELFLHAVFWTDLANSRLRTLLDARFSPVRPLAQEWPELLGWLVEREVSPDVRLSASAVLSEGRAGLLEVAAELASLSHSRPVGAWNEEAAWARLERAARRAKGEQGPDMDCLCDALHLFIRLRGQRETPARFFSMERERSLSGFTPPSLAEELADLPGLVLLARTAAGRPAAERRRG
ncbi:hypothetical protein [Cystobacter ferrugineus]|uniref:Uncharacterized protein n=1 Tax=Cystobacter ferrugineus TaxID=83449 RepID=A0A1L9ATX3_9BACT|nr:hypothetical protein [Cystobacter ferrugineus]OJH33459.1 hypothetical protein BON30_48690 [Cystobacter ferrugineus]